MMFRLRLACVAVCLVVPGTAAAHYCSNIFTGPARFVVKPEKTTLCVNGATKLRVYLQNNWPYKMYGVQMRLNGLTGYSATVTPTSRDIYPGQNVAYDFTITGTTGTLTVTAGLQVLFRVGSWRGPSDRLVYQSPTQVSLTSSGYYGAGTAQQAPSLSLATLFDLYPSATLPAGTPTFGHTGMQQLILLFGYRFCWDSGGDYACGAQDCPSPCTEQGSFTSIDTFPQDCLRAGVEIAIRKSKLGSYLTSARDGAVNALKGTGSAMHKCLAAVVGGYLWQGASDTTPFTTTLAASANGVSTSCQNAGLRALNGSNSSTCPSTMTQVERATCAAAEGLNNNNTPVTSLLMPNSGDGASGGGSTWQENLYWAYMLMIVQGYRRAQGGAVPFYADAGGALATDGTSCAAPDTAVVVDQAKVDAKKDTVATPDQPKVDLPKLVDAKKDTVKPPDQKKPDAVTKKDGPVKKDGPKAPDAKPSDALATDAVQPTETAPPSDAVTPTETGVQVEQGVKKEAGTNNQNKLDGGCGCAVAEAHGGAPALLVIALFTLVLCIRRRKR